GRSGGPVQLVRWGRGPLAPPRWQASGRSRTRRAGRARGRGRAAPRPSPSCSARHTSQRTRQGEGAPGRPEEKEGLLPEGGRKARPGRHRLAAGLDKAGKGPWPGSGWHKCTKSSSSASNHRNRHNTARLTKPTPTNGPVAPDDPAKSDGEGKGSRK